MARFYLKNHLFKDEKGQGMVEYGLILALVAVAAIIALTSLGEGLDGILGRVNNELTGAME
ncbi:MAG: Flp family type IVb pilin [Firmicutes bacterium]|nr:Flp family type IVb pilin [Bacillota bacterium]